MQSHTLTDFINIATQVFLQGTPWFLVLLFFFWSISSLIWTSGNAEKRKQAGQRLVWGIVALFVLFSIGGIIAVLNNTFFGSNSSISPNSGDTIQQNGSTQNLQGVSGATQFNQSSPASNDASWEPFNTNDSQVNNP